MKKYCLTQCAKTKLYAIGTFLTILLSVIVMLAIFLAIMAGLGWIVVTLIGYSETDLISVGLATLVLLGLLYAVLYYSINVLQAIWKWIKRLPDFTFDKLKLPKFKCKIFEECTK